MTSLINYNWFMFLKEDIEQTGYKELRMHRIHLKVNKLIMTFFRIIILNLVNESRFSCLLLAIILLVLLSQYKRQTWIKTQKNTAITNACLFVLSTYLNISLFSKLENKHLFFYLDCLRSCFFILMLTNAFLALSFSQLMATVGIYI